MSTPRLPARVFYGIIVAGVAFGVLAAGGAARAHLKADGPRPDARRVWGDVADDLVGPVAVMVGGTFGGLAGFGVAVLADRRK
ncbi:MAG: hypothetical protein JWO38_1558 [Gemmataceae bacterium]|nr:hypothetical protein [Gemmataceae bacterium]